MASLLTQETYAFLLAAMRGRPDLIVLVTADYVTVVSTSFVTVDPETIPPKY